jgi:phosphate-selective porin OprO and OprP
MEIRDLTLSGLKSCALLILSIGMLPTGTAAQTAPIERIEAIERQIRNLQTELQQLKDELGQAKQQLRQSRGEVQRAKEEARQAQQAAEQARQNAARAASAETQVTQAAVQVQAAAVLPPPPPGSGIKVDFPGGRPTISTSDGSISFAVGTQIQFDMGGYFQNPTATTQFPHLNDGVNLRRGRIFFNAKYGDFYAIITPDFGGSPDGSPTLYEANLNWTGFKPVTATVGYFKPYFSLYDSQSSNNFLLMERPSIVEIARNVAAGDARAALGAKATNDGKSLPIGWTGSYFASAYLTGAPFGANSANNLTGEQLGFVGRLAGRPYYDQDFNLHLEFSGENVFHPSINGNGTPGVNVQTLIFQDRPEDRAADQNRLIGTGNLSASSANVYGGGLGASWRNFLVQGEYYAINMNQAKNPPAHQPSLAFNGGYVEGGWVITGEPIRYSVGAAAFARPKVAEPWTLDGPGIGAWELSARYSVTNLNSNVIPGVSQTVTGGIYGGLQKIVGVALSWYPNDWVRFYLQFQYTNVDRLNSAGTVQIGQQFETLAGRVQGAF